VLFKKSDNLKIADLSLMGFRFLKESHPCQEIKPEKMTAEPEIFFYGKNYNTCWGHKVAIDLDGTIKPCLWSSEILGNINDNNLQELILSGGFDKYWQLTKDKIETCNSCEFRYACSDCRVAACREVGSLSAKTAHCGYNPRTGEWKE